MSLRNICIWLTTFSMLLWSINLLTPHYAVPTSLEAWMLDVGQGESILIREPGGKLLLFDGGPDNRVLSQLGAVLPPWQHYLDLVILSHNHADHIRGLIPVLQRFKIGAVWDSGSIYGTGEFHMFEQQIERTHTTTTHVFFDQKSCTAICPTPIAFGQAYLQVYHPLHDATDEHPTAEHDTDVVVKVSWKHQSILLTGDLNEQHEEDILSACTPPICTLHATLLQVPHHGSATGLTPDFLSAIHPSEAWICVGQPNPYGHPRREILQELTEAHIPTHRTDQEGRVHRILMEQYPP